MPTLPPGPRWPGVLRRLAALAPALLLAACAYDGAAAEKRFGAAVRLAVAQQTLDPGAGANRAPVTGMDGASARAALQSYQQSFAVPAPHGDTFTIGVSSGK